LWVSRWWLFVSPLRHIRFINRRHVTYARRTGDTVFTFWWFLNGNKLSPRDGRTKIRTAAHARRTRTRSFERTVIIVRTPCYLTGRRRPRRTKAFRRFASVRVRFPYTANAAAGWVLLICLSRPIRLVCLRPRTVVVAWSRPEYCRRFGFLRTVIRTVRFSRTTIAVRRVARQDCSRFVLVQKRPGLLITSVTRIKIYP